LMGEVAGRYSDLAILTSDNPGQKILWRLSMRWKED